MWTIEGIIELSEGLLLFCPLLCFFTDPVSWPFVRVTDTTVRVQSSVVFTCFSADPGVSIRWLFNKQSLQLTERMTLSPSKCQLSIDPVWREDAGKYQCEVYNPVSSKSSLPVCLSVMEEWPTSLLSSTAVCGHFRIDGVQNGDELSGKNCQLPLMYCLHC